MSNSVDIHPSELSQTSDVKTVHPVPPLIKWGLILFIPLVIFLAAYLVVFGLHVDNGSENVAMASEKADALDVTPIPDTIVRRNGADETAQSIANASASPVLADVRSSIESLDSRVRNVEDELNNTLPAIRASMTDSQSQDVAVRRLSDELQDVTSTLHELVSTVDELSIRLAAQDEQLNKLSQRFERVRNASRSHNAIPAFSLLSIDRWGGSDSAVLDLNGQITTASVGDSRAGWTLQAIRRPGCIDVERDKDRKSASVCIAKGGS
jgi:uncharacterized coiled-coil protein SlyX